MASTKSTPELRAQRNAYMKQWRAGREAGENKKRRELLAHLRETDPVAYEAHLQANRERNAKYLAKPDKLEKKLALEKSKNWRYTPEVGAAKREKFFYAYRTKTILKSAKSRAAKNGVKFDLTEEWYEEQLQKACSATGLPFDTTTVRGPWVPHIDRIVAGGDYTVENCRLVCGCFNYARQNWGDEAVLIMAEALVNRAKGANP